METQARPFDTLNRARGKRVVVYNDESESYIGKLNAFDITLNITLSDAEWLDKDGKPKAKLGTVFILGGKIKHIMPGNA